MAWWIVVLSIAAQRSPLPRALEIVAGKQPIDQFRSIRRSSASRANDRSFAGNGRVDVQADLLEARRGAASLSLARRPDANHLSAVRNDPTGTVTGHAWLESEGQPILESTPPEYVATYSFPSNERFDPQLASLTLE
jgi:hypothetical protein